MKSFKTLFSALVLCAIFQLSAYAQTKIWVGPSGGTWHEALHWSPQGIPDGMLQDVIIPENSVVNIGISSDITAFSNTITLEAGATINKTSNSTLFMNGGGVFAPTSQINFYEGNIGVGSGSTVTVNGALNILGELPKSISSSSTSTTSIDITGTMFIASSPEPLFLQEISIRILPSGMLTVEDATLDVSAFNARLSNEGLIQKNSGTGIFTIDTTFENDNGTINVSSGAMEVSGSSTLINGEYNVNQDGYFELGGAAIHNISGMITGQLDGPFILNSGARTLPEDDAIFNFSGPAGVQFSGGALAATGTMNTAFVNRGLFTVINIGSAQQPFMGSAAILRNEGLVVFDTTVDAFVLSQSAILENTNDGTVTILEDTDIFGPVSNSGLIEKTGGTEEINFVSLINNEEGVFDIASGGVNFSSNFEGKGVVTGIGSFRTNTSDAIESTIAPGNDGPGTLTFENPLQFNATTDCEYQLQINGTTPDTEYDVFAINAPARLSGTFDIQLGFAPQIDDEFEVFTATSITECNLPTQTTGFFDGMVYIFDVVCNLDNVVLRVVDITLGVTENTLSNSIAYPNPTRGAFMVQLDAPVSEINTTITNILGQVIAFERFVNTDTLKFNLQGGPGIYFVSLTTSERVSETIKIIKK